MPSGQTLREPRSGFLWCICRGLGMTVAGSRLHTQGGLGDSQGSPSVCVRMTGPGRKEDCWNETGCQKGVCCQGDSYTTGQGGGVGRHESLHVPHSFWSFEGPAGNHRPCTLPLRDRRLTSLLRHSCLRLPSALPPVLEQWGWGVSAQALCPSPSESHAPGLDRVDQL